MKTIIRSVVEWSLLILIAVSCADMGVETKDGDLNQSDFPSHVGDTWTYAISDNVQKKNGAAIVTVVGKMSGTPPVYLWESNTSGVIETRYCQMLNDTLKMHYWEDNAFTTVTYVFPLQAGKQWQGSPQGRTCMVLGVGPDEVPCGKFDSCFEIVERWSTREDDYEIRSWLVPGVGLVRMSYKETESGKTVKDVSWELIDYQVSPE